MDLANLLNSYLLFHPLLLPHLTLQLPDYVIEKNEALESVLTYTQEFYQAVYNEI
jgi:hypothetical protein